MMFDETAMNVSSVKGVIEGEKRRLSAMKDILGKVKCDVATSDNLRIAIQGLELSIKEMDWAISLLNRIKDKEG